MLRAVRATDPRQDLWDSYAFSFALNSPRRLLGLLLSEAFSTDIRALSVTDPERAALLGVARFEYEVKKGGFAQLLFNLRNMGLDVLGQALEHAGARVAAQHYQRALAVCQQMLGEYHAFLASDYRSPNALKDALHGVSLDYLPLVPVELEVAPLLARFVVDDITVTAIRALRPGSLARELKQDLAAGSARPLVLDAVAAALRATDPGVQRELFDNLGHVPKEASARLVAQLMASAPEHAIVLAIPLHQADSTDESLAAWVGWAVALGGRAAVEVLALVRSAVLVSGGDFSLRKPVGVWPSMPLFSVLRAALASPDPEVRAAASRVPGPWSWSAAERSAAARDAADDDEAHVIESFAAPGA